MSLRVFDASKPIECTPEDHLRVKRDPVRWRHETRKDGIRVDTKGVRYDWRTHLVCGGAVVKRMRKPRAK